MKEEPAPCPCGGKPIVDGLQFIPHEDSGDYVENGVEVKCQSCGREESGSPDDEGLAIREWNARIAKEKT